MFKYRTLFFLYISCLLHSQAFSQKIYQPKEKEFDFSGKSSSGFIENKGQLMDQYNKPNQYALFLLHLGNGLNVQLTKNGFSYDTYSVQNPNTPSIHQLNTSKKSANNGPTTSFHRVDISFLQSLSEPEVVVESPMTGKLHYIGGSQDAEDIRKYKKVTYKNLYPKIDLVFEVRQGISGRNFEYHFVIHPGGDANDIRMQYNGAVSTQIENGQVILNLKNGRLKEKIPASYISPKDPSDIHLLHDNNRVNVQYQLIGKDTYGFNIPSHDQKQILIIDPVPDLQWGTYYGDYLDDSGNCIARDAGGNIFVGGWTNNNMNIATVGAFESTMSGYSSGVLWKFSQDGTLEWCTYYGAESYTTISGICVGKDGNILVTGRTYSPTGLGTPGVHKTTMTGTALDAFIAKFTAGGKRIWGTYYGGDQAESSNCISTDQAGSIFIGGQTYSQTDISTHDTHQPSYGSAPLLSSYDGDAFIAKFNSSGQLLKGSYCAGSKLEWINSLAIDETGNIYVTGRTESANNISSKNAHQPVLAGENDGFLVKFDNNLLRLWGTYYGGKGSEDILAVIVDKFGNSIITGETNSNSGISTPGSHQAANSGFIDAFIAKFDPSGNRAWGTFYGGSQVDRSNGITIDAQNNIIITGYSNSPSGITTGGVYQPTNAGALTTFITKFTAIGARVWGTFYGRQGPRGGGEGRAVVTNPAGDVFVTGCTLFTSNIANCYGYQQQWSENLDMFLGRFSEKSIIAEPSIHISSNANFPTCSSSTITFTAEISHGGDAPTYEWVVNGTSAGTNEATFTSQNFQQNDIVKCILKSNSECVQMKEASSNAITIQTIAQPTPSINISASSIKICTGTAVTFTTSIQHGGTQPKYDWKRNNVSIGITTATFTTSEISDGDQLSCDLISDLTCATNTSARSNVIRMNVMPDVIPKLSVQADKMLICPGEPVDIRATTENAGMTPTFRWYLNNSLIEGRQPDIRIKEIKNGDMVYCTIEPASGCSGPVKSNEISIGTYSLPKINLSPADTTIQWGSSVQLRTGIAGNFESFHWEPKIAIDNPTSLTPIVKPDSSTTYTFFVATGEGCSITQPIRVYVTKGFYMPNAFSPNMDGVNDIFLIPERALDHLDNFIIFDRWGSNIFQSNNTAIGWDGTNNGKMVVPGTYIYVVTGIRNGKHFKQKGIVILVREGR
jgi:gliding motility-associated-like protein